ncbi:MAG: hypothetical protein QOI10_1278 [Solirubrobacterales bacterium]|jgi:hypothetical protein|nr:hypothetical protein [Solirubrobacterales bacterium]
MNEITATELLRRAATVSDAHLARLGLGDALEELLAEVASEPRGNVRPKRPFGLRIPAIRAARPVLIALLAIAVVAVTAAAVPQVRAALDDLRDTLSGYLDADNPPGRPLESSDNPPAWLKGNGQTGQRVVASAEGHSLYLSHNAEGGPDATYTFSLDDSVGIGDTQAGWEAQLAGTGIYVLGRTGSAFTTDRTPLFGITAGNVAEVELHYYGGGTETASAETGGFVLMMDPYGHPAEIVAKDAAGNVLQTVNAVKYGNYAPQGEKRNKPRHNDPPGKSTYPGKTVYLG